MVIVSPVLSLLEILSRIRGLKSQVDGVRDKVHLLRQLAGTPPSEEGEVAEAQTLAAELKEAWKGLNADSLPSGVLEFLRDAGANQGAALDKLSPSVRTWLEQHGLETSFTIRTR